MSLSSILTNISQIDRVFTIDQEIYFSCIIPSFDWFEKEFKIKDILEPTLLKIKNINFKPSLIDQNDRIIISQLTNHPSNIIKKYILTLSLELDYTMDLIIYESKTNNIEIVYESNKTIDYSKTIITSNFLKLAISTKKDLDFDISETKIIKDDNFNQFMYYYTKAVDILPEEIIKNY